MRAPERTADDIADDISGTRTTDTPSEATATSRRSFLKVTAAGAGALVIGTYLPFLRGSDATAAGLGNGTGGGAGPAAGSAADLNAFVRVAPDDTVTVVCKHFEMGQGTTTGLSTLVAEELDAAWSQMRFAFAPNDASVYNNLFFGPVQATGGSTSIANSFEQMRRAGATARAMLVQAAADRWGVPPAEISVADGAVSHEESGREASFGELAADAAALPAPDPESVALKSPEEWSLIGTEVPRLDSPDKTTGAAQFAIDVRRPGMLRAVVARAPRFGATVASFDPAPALAIDGVTDVVQIHNGVAVLATDTWAAIMGKRALDITWDEGAAETRSSAEIMDDYRAMADGRGAVARRDGDADAALAAASEVIEAEFTFPYLSHATMEPMTGVIELGEGTAEIWAGSQIPTIDAGVAAQVLGIDAANVKINTVLAGGSFGRRGNKVGDWTAELAAIAKAIDGRAPVQLVWTREDDVRGGFYRPLTLHRVRAGVDTTGGVSGWRHHIVTQSITIGTAMESMMVQDGIDHSSVEGTVDSLYDLGADVTVELSTPRHPVTTLWWRSVGNTHTAFVMETMMDELARAAGRDPVEFRLARLASRPRAAACLELAAEKAGWGGGSTDAEAGPGGGASGSGVRRGRGVAYHYSFSTHVAEVVDVTVDGSDVSVDRVVAAVDCGIAVNPDVIRAQVEGAIGFAVSAALRNEITLGDGGTVDQSNFHDYEPTRMREMPEVEVHIVPSTEAPTGIGEPGVPPLAPAIANAVFDATGRRLRDLPLRLEG